jgi:DNA-binding GntR family transcriptional regulator
MHDRLATSEKAGQPQYLVLRDSIAMDIEAGRIAPASRLTSERRLQSETGMSRGTIREALSQLEAEGLIYRRDRSGWYVSPPAVTYDPTRWDGFIHFVGEQGRVPSTRTLATQTILASEQLAKIFGIAVDTPLYLIERCRSIDGRAVLSEWITVNPEFAPNLLANSFDGSLTEILKNQYKIEIHRNRVDMRPCALVKEAAELLGVKSGTPGLKLTRTIFNAAGRVVEYDREYWRHDAIRVSVDISLKG